VISPDPAIADRFVEVNLYDLRLVSGVGIELLLTLPTGCSLPDEDGLGVVHVDPLICTPMDIARMAVDTNASKLIYPCRSSGIRNADGELENRLDASTAEVLLGGVSDGKRNREVVSGSMGRLLESAVWACRNGVERAHFLCGTVPGDLLRELFSSAGVGTMVTLSLERYEVLRQGVKADAAEIAVFLSACEIRFPEIAITPSDYTLFCEDDEIVGTVRLSLAKGVGHLSCIAVSDHFRFNDVFRQLLGRVVSEARAGGVEKLVINHKHNQSWLLVSPVPAELGFLADGEVWSLAVT